MTGFLAGIVGAVVVIVVRARLLDRSERAMRMRALKAANDTPFTGFQQMQERYLKSLN